MHVSYLKHFSWTIKINGAKNTVFAGEEFKLQIKFTPRYPFEAPIVSILSAVYCQFYPKFAINYLTILLHTKFYGLVRKQKYNQFIAYSI